MYTKVGHEGEMKQWPPTHEDDGARNKATSIERDSFEENLGVEHAIREELLDKTKEQRKKMDVIVGSFKSARNAWLRNKDNSSNS